MDGPTEVEQPKPAGPRRSRWARWVLVGVACFVAVAVAGGVYVWRQLHPDAKYRTVAYTVPNAPELTPASGEAVYRIDPTASSVTYGVDEKIVGQDASHAEGSTSGIAGDLALNKSDLGASRVGPIMVDVSQLHSDNSLRDARLRDDFLESHDNPLAHIDVSGFKGLSGPLVEGQTYHFDLETRLTVKETTAPVTWKVDATMKDGRLTATAATKVKMSTFDIGPISLAGLVTTSDDVDLTMKLTAVDPAQYRVPTEIAAPAGTEKSGKSPSFKTDIQPVLESSCASCHNTGQVGAEQWKLDTAGDAASISDGLGTVVKSRYMPPWPASEAGVPLAHSKRLDQKTIDTLLQWSNAGGQLDVPESTPIKPTPDAAGPQPRQDAVLKMPEAYAGSLEKTNDYRCFVLDPGFTDPTYLTGYQVTPDQRQEIHHAQIFHINAAQVADGQTKSGKDGKPGWSCYAGPGVSGGRRTATAPGAAVPNHQKVRSFALQPGLIAGWVPGQDPVIYPQDSGVLFQPGDALVLQIHYHYEDEPTPDQSTVALQTAPATTPHKTLDVINPIGPVEIPCMPGAVAAACDRKNAPPGVEGALLGLCGKTADELAATFRDGVASSTCDSKVPEDGQIVGAMGHMHTLGKSFRLTLNPGTPQEQVLLDIPTWNFDWQMNYELATPIQVKKGDTVRMDCSWDRNLDPNRPPKYIVFAEGTEDEMCFSTYAVIPDVEPPPP